MLGNRDPLLWRDPLRNKLRDEGALGDELAKRALIDWYEERGIYEKKD